jgi:hypothetical protein
MKPKDWEPLAIVAVCAFVVWLGAVGLLNAIDDEQDRAVAACKAPVRRTK